jgi:hypothetical protein
MRRLNPWDLWGYVAECPDCLWLEAPSLLREAAEGEVSGKYVCCRCEAVWLKVLSEEPTPPVPVAAPERCAAERGVEAPQDALTRARRLPGPNLLAGCMWAHGLPSGAAKINSGVRDAARRNCHHWVAPQRSGGS